MRHNDYPATLLMEPAANDEPSRYRMTPAASTRARKAAWEAPTSAELTRTMDYHHDCHAFNTGNKPGPGGIVVPIASFDGYAEFYTQRAMIGLDPRHYGAVGDGITDDTAAIAAGAQIPAGAALTGTKTEPEAEVWHKEAPTVAGIYETSWNGNPPTPRHWDGAAWSQSGRCAKRGGLRQGEWDKRLGTRWLRLIEADTPAPATQEGRRFVCIRAHQGTNEWNVGDIATLPRGLASANGPDNWRPCDADGWISHTPTADAVCPVPDGVEFETRRRNGRVIGMDRLKCLWQTRTDGGHAEPTAWRPIQA